MFKLVGGHATTLSEYTNTILAEYENSTDYELSILGVKVYTKLVDKSVNEKEKKINEDALQFFKEQREEYRGTKERTIDPESIFGIKLAIGLDELNGYKERDKTLGRCK